MRVAIITSGYLPVPAALGGAVESLNDYIIEENEKKPIFNFTIFTCYHPESEIIVKDKKHTTAEFIHTPVFIRLLDKIIYYFFKHILKKKKNLSYRYILQRLFFIERVSFKLSKGNFDKILIENHASLFLILKKRNNLNKYKNCYYYHLHNEQNNFYGCEEIIRKSQQIITVSSYISNKITEALGGIDEKKVKILKNCVNTNIFGKEADNLATLDFRKSYGIKENEKVVLFAGRLTQEKGIKELMLAFQNIKVDNVKLIIAGGYLSGAKDVKSNYERTLEQLAISMKDRIIFTGYIPYNQMPIVYLMADIIVVPSIWNDPAPLTVIESISSGIPLITTNSGGIVEYANKECAIILERDNDLIENLRESIDLLLSNDEKRKEMSIAAKGIAKEWTLENYFNKFATLLNS